MRARHPSVARVACKSAAPQAMLGPREARGAEVEPRAGVLRALHPESQACATAERRAQRRLLAVGPDLEVPHRRAGEPVHGDLTQPAACELDRDELHGICVLLLVEAGRVLRRDGDGRLPDDRDQQVDEVDAAFEQRTVRHPRAPRRRLLPRAAGRATARPGRTRAGR